MAAEGATRFQAELAGVVLGQDGGFDEDVVGTVLVERFPHRPSGAPSGSRQLVEGFSKLLRGNLLGGFAQAAGGLWDSGEELLTTTGLLSSSGPRPASGPHTLRMTFHLRIGSNQIEAVEEWSSHEDLRNLADPVRFPATIRSADGDRTEIDFALTSPDIPTMIDIATGALRNP
jgi:hypothetical protein